MRPLPDGMVWCVPTRARQCVHHLPDVVGLPPLGEASACRHSAKAWPVVRLGQVTGLRSVAKR